MRHLLATALLFVGGSSYADPGDALIGAAICTPTIDNIFVDSNTTKWLPTLRADLLKQVLLLASAYRLTQDCRNADETERADLLVSVSATDEIKNGSRAYVIGMEIHNRLVDYHLWYDYSLGITSSSVTDNKSRILELNRGLVDGLAAAYNKINFIK